MTAIHQSVRDVWVRFNEPIESVVPHMYLDVLELVTTGMGNLIRTVESALALPWRRADGSLASAAEVRAQHAALRAHGGLARRHYRYASDYLETRFGHALTLDDDAISELCVHKLQSNVEWIAERHFPELGEWPADAQLACLSMAWAMGPDWPRKFPTCKGLLIGRNFRAAGTIAGPRAPCDISSTGNPGVIPRNQLNRAHYIEASTDLARQFPSVLHGPCTLGALRAGWTSVLSSRVPC